MTVVSSISVNDTFAPIKGLKADCLGSGWQ
jgi:hypothetical protein